MWTMDPANLNTIGDYYERFYGISFKYYNLWISPWLTEYYTTKP